MKPISTSASTHQRRAINASRRRSSVAGVVTASSLFAILVGGYLSVTAVALPSKTQTVQAISYTERALREAEKHLEARLETLRAFEDTLESDDELMHEALVESTKSFAPEQAFPPAEQELRRRKQMGFIAGLIAMHRPSLKDSGAIARSIVEVSEEKGIDPFYVAAIISVESRFLKTAKSHVGAKGLMQLMPRTAAEVYEQTIGGEQLPSLDNPRLNLNLGIEYITKLEYQFRGNRYKALAAYNWGQGNVYKVKQDKNRFPKSVQRYASKILERTLVWRKHYESLEAATTARG